MKLALVMKIILISKLMIRNSIINLPSISSKNQGFSYEPNINGAKGFQNEEVKVSSNNDNKFYNSKLISPNNDNNSIIRTISPNSILSKEKFEIVLRREADKPTSITKVTETRMNNNSKIKISSGRSSQDRLRKPMNLK